MTKPIVVLNLGSQSLGLADFRWKPESGLILNDFRFREILADPATESTRLNQVSIALGEMLTELEIRNGQISYAVANQSAFSRFVKLPPVDEKQIERVIRFEAQQNVPFPIEEVIWDYQLLGRADDGQWQAILVVIKRDLLKGINSIVEQLGFQTSLIDVATMALYNAFRYSYPDVSGCSLVIDIGARTTNLLFVEPGKVFSRSIAIGGSSISFAIAKEFKETLAAAELRKKREGFRQLLPREGDTGNSDESRASGIVRTNLNRLYAEVTRSITFYRGEQQGTEPDRVFLAGGGAGGPHVPDFFREKMRLPVEFLDPLRRVEVAGPNLALGANHLLGGLVGLAMRNVVNCPIELDLTPSSVRSTRQVERRRLCLASAAVCVLLGLINWVVYYRWSEQFERRAMEKLQPRVKTLCAFETSMNQMQRTTAALENEMAPLIKAIEDRDAWPGILEDLNSRLPVQDIWITELVATSGERMVAGIGPSGQKPSPAVQSNAKKPASEPIADGIFVRGLYLVNPRQQEVVIDYFRNLIGSPRFKIDPDNQSRVIRPSVPNSNEWAFPYELRLELQTPLRWP